MSDETERVKVYRLVVIGPEEMADYLANTKYPNWCMNPIVMETDVREVQWSDDHPLNRQGHEKVFAELFAAPKPNAAQQFAAAGEHFALAAEAGGVEVAVQPCVVACSTEDASTLVAAGLGGIVEDYGDGTALVSIGSREAGADDDRPDEFMRGFAEGARRAEAEAWEVLRDALAPDPLRGESEPVLTLPEGVTLATAVGHVAGALAEVKRHALMVSVQAESREGGTLWVRVDSLGTVVAQHDDSTVTIRLGGKP
jgi:hypothetical protein